MSVGKEMSLRDPDYKPSVQNPFLTLPRLREGRKVFGSSRDLFSSCFELPSPARVTTPTGSGYGTSLSPLNSHHSTNSPLDMAFVVQSPSKRGTRSLPSSPTSLSRRSSLADVSEFEHFTFDDRTPKQSVTSVSNPASSNPVSKDHPSYSNLIRSSLSSSRFEDHLFQGRVQLLKRLYSGGAWYTQDDSAVEMSQRLLSERMHGFGPYVQSHSASYILKRRGSCESGFYSVGTDDIFLDSGMSPARSLGSSLLTVSDLEEDLRAASAFLSNQRTSSVFTDSNDDLSQGLSMENEAPPNGTKGYEKDIRDIVQYFEASCHLVDPRRCHKGAKSRPGPRGSDRSAASVFWQQKDDKEPLSLLPRSQKIDSLIKRVVEKESRDRIRSKIANSSSSHQRQQVCDGLVRSKLHLFDHTKRQGRSRCLPLEHEGFVKSKLAIFDSQTMLPPELKENSSKKQAEKKLGLIKPHCPEN